MTSTTITSEPPKLAGWLHALTFSLNRSRFSVLILIAGLVLLLSGQGQDALIAYAEDGKTGRVALAAAFWAFSIWGWSRLLLDVRYYDLPGCASCYNWCRKWIPRVLGSLAFVVLAFTAYQTEQLSLVWWALGGFVLFLVIVVRRRPAMRKMSSMLEKSRVHVMKTVASSMALENMEEMPPYTNFREMLGISGHDKIFVWQHWKLRGLIALAMFLSFLVLAALGIFAPVWLGSRTGALILFFVWAATWLPFGSWMSYVADRRGVPLISILVILALVSSYFNDNHAIRHANKEQNVDSRPSVTEGLKAWDEINKPDGKGAIPFVIVATAGGGIRAAYWTATILGDLQDEANKFSQRTFAISGVSGGSVGATVYRALLAIPPEQRSKVCPNTMDCAQRVLGHDFLGPLSAALLYPDLAQRFFPIPIFPDRAAALEESWEQAFYDVTKDDELNLSLASLGKSIGKPSLFLNATWVNNGRRIVASNLRYATNDPVEAKAFSLSNDELAELGYDIRLSTAAHNSARFPFVSPPGMWKRDGKLVGRLQDGGLFENYGAETAMEILNLACQKFACPLASKEMKRKLRNIRPVVILISSDPTLPKNLAYSPPDLPPIKFGYEVRSTFRTFERVRSGHGSEAAFQLIKWTEQNHGEIFQFRMCQTDSRVGEPPLGWELSNAARITINSYLFGNSGDKSRQPVCYKDNADAKMKLIKLLSES